MSSQIKKRKRRPRAQDTCTCKAYHFPHRRNGGECDGRFDEEPDDGSCYTCGGSGGGEDYWRCPSCHGSGLRRVRREHPDDY